MPTLTIILDQKDGHGIVTRKGQWADLVPKIGTDQLIDLTDDSRAKLSVADVRGGTSGRRSAVLFRVDMPDGRTLLVQTTLALLRDAVAAMTANEERG